MKGLAAFSLALVSILGGGAAAQEAAVDLGISGEQEYAVYSALIEQHYARSLHRPLVIDAATISGSDRFAIDGPFAEMLTRALEPVSTETVASYVWLSTRSSIVEPRFRTDLPLRIVSQAVLDTIFSQCPRGWDLLEERFPGCHGYVSLSGAAINPAGDEALVYTEDHCGVLCGEGTFVLLLKEDDAWKVKRKLTFWID